MYYDLNVPYTPTPELERTLFLLSEFGYNVVALTHTITKLPTELSCAIPAKLPKTKAQILRRCNLIISDPTQNHRLQALAAHYDIIAVRPTNEKALQQACLSLDCDLISLDLTQRFETHFRMKMLATAVERGIKFEICYGPAVAGDANSRRNLFGNASQLVRALRGRGIVLSSEASSALACRAPGDVRNLATLWGLGPDRAKEALVKLARSVVVTAQMRRTSFRGVINVIEAGDKRKAEAEPEAAAPTIAPKISKRQLKRQRLAAT